MGSKMTSRDKLARWIADRMPKRVIYFGFIRAFSKATTGKWSDTEVPGVTAMTVLKRWTEK